MRICSSISSRFKMVAQLQVMPPKARKKPRAKKIKHRIGLYSKFWLITKNVALEHGIMYHIAMAKARRKKQLIFAAQ